MGHIRNQYPPDTIKWRKVVAALAEGEDVGDVAAATTKAAQAGLELAKADKGLAHAVWLLAQLTHAARSENIAGELDRVGIDPGSCSSSAALIGGFSDAMDSFLSKTHSRTDIGEMAQLAACETIAKFVGDRSPNLFASGPDAVQIALRDLSKQKGFAELAHSFFGRFTERYLGYHLSRELSMHVGVNQRFADPSDHTAFLEKLGGHSHQVAAIVREFAAGWYAKSRYETGLSKASAKGFARYSITKIQAELQHREKRDGV